MAELNGETPEFKEIFYIGRDRVESLTPVEIAKMRLEGITK